MTAPYAAIPTTAQEDDIRKGLVDEAIEALLLKLTSANRIQELLASLPTSDPNVAGKCWWNNQVLTVSKGGAPQ